MSRKKLIVIGGGAAGFFAAINAAALCDAEVQILEKSNQVLSKVKVSGGGRCNVTHACFVPDDLIEFYPRGGKELLGPFYKFNPADTISWFAERGVNLHTEQDGRMFPETNSSQTIIDCFLHEAKKHNVQIHTGTAVTQIQKGTNHWEITTTDGKHRTADNVIFTTGSSQHMWDMLKGLGHTIETPVPSLFTLHIQDQRIMDLMGVALPDVRITLEGSGITTTGPMLITHWGISGPAVLKLSAWGARILAERKYQSNIILNFLPQFDTNSCLAYLQENRVTMSKKQVTNTPIHPITSRLWQQLTAFAGIVTTTKWADLSNAQLSTLASILTASKMAVKGKSTFKEEFVTCGGIRLSEVNMRTMESRLHPGLYFAGEVLDIDAVTGGFNFQAAWTTAWLAAQHIAIKP